MQGPKSLPIVPLAVLALAATPAPAAAAEWLCHLSADLVRLVCVAEPPAPAPEPAAPPPEAARPTGAAAGPVVVNGTRFPLDPGRMWVVDLWSPPNERADVERLARATICYRSPGCTVVVVPWGR